MPLLPLETFLWPENLLEPLAAEPEAAAQWWVLHTRPRAEKTLARKILGRGLSFYLPLHVHRWRARGRQFSSHLPLFPGYVFLFGDAAARLVALETNLVIRTLTTPDSEHLWADLRRVHRLIASGETVSPESNLGPGSRVEVTGGPFAGMTGKVIRRGKKFRFLVEVEFLQQGVSVEVEGWMIQPLKAQGVTGSAP